MKFIGDFHIHSHYSRATSKELKPEFLDYWANRKGIKVVGTGDFTHPGWLGELSEKLEPAEDGLFKLKREFVIPNQSNANDPVRFMLTTEISNIYKKGGKVRKVHNVIFAPDFEVAEKIQNKLSGMGFNITSDGRPILGLDSKKLLEISLDISDKIFFVPAHIWTPWFSVLGSKSGFDSVEECFEDLSDQIFAVETGLSTDPPMNWMVSSLDKYTLIANSDAHSPEKLGRNANIFKTEISYPDIIEAMKTGDPEKFLGTIDFFPEEGKYHYDGHRKCGIRWNPLETLEHNEICPVCKKPVTIGVLNRVAQLADRDDLNTRPNRHDFISLVPLKEILAELEGVGPDSQKAERRYDSVIKQAGNEFNLLLHWDLKGVEKVGGEILGEAIKRMRNREIFIREGYDGEFGVIRVFREGETFHSKKQHALFNEPGENYIEPNHPRPLISFDIEKFRKLKRETTVAAPEPIIKFASDLFTPVGDHLFRELNPDQKKAAEHQTGPALILAGPGTGKTKVLTTRIANLVMNKGIDPKKILAVTFTNKAAGEMKQRLEKVLKNRPLSSGLTIQTFHAFGLSVLKDFINRTGRQNNFNILDDENRVGIIKEIAGNSDESSAILERITTFKQQLIRPDNAGNDPQAKLYQRYEKKLTEINSFDVDDLVTCVVYLFQDYQEILQHFHDRFHWILIDEYQDVNLAQYKLVDLLCPGDNPNLFAIGDPNQAIYGFRGADVQFIQRFREDYPLAQIYNLNTSYRCSDTILKASEMVLASHSSILQGLHQGVKIQLVEQATEKSEAEYMARTIEQKIGGLGFFSIDSNVAAGNKEQHIESLSDFAILCRISRIMPPIEKALKDHNIPYQKVGNDSLLKSETVRNLVDLLKLSEDKQNGYLLESLNKRKFLKKDELKDLISELETKRFDKKVEFLIKLFSDKNPQLSLLLDMLVELIPEVENVSQLTRKLAYHTSVDGWNPGIEAVNLMTLHASKGLEFGCVFIPGCEEGIMPFSIYEKLKANTGEERRLLYVGMTRAKNYLCLSHARKRFLLGKEYQLSRSTFLGEIEEQLFEHQKYEFMKEGSGQKSQLELF
ncbi:MAG: UvrD-helicase domain-containing protein [Bacteroidales bacterium]|nr:UvrD-helicase domain-containing protein [Bacteroidales bacterium]